MLLLAGCARVAPVQSVRTAASHAPAASPRARAAVNRPVATTAALPAVHPRAVAAKLAGASAHATAPSPAPVSTSPPPAIYSASATPPVVHGGQALVWDVRTTPDVVSVSARTTLIVLPLQHLGPGHFGLTFSVPQGVPGFFHGTYRMDVSAVTSAGATLHRDVAVTFQ